MSVSYLPIKDYQMEYMSLLVIRLGLVSALYICTRAG